MRRRRVRQGFAAEGIEPQAHRHAHRRRAEAVVETDFVLQQAGNQRAEKRADVDGNIENGKTRVAQRAQLVAFVQRADHRAGRGFHPAAAQRDQHQPAQQPADAGHEREHDVAAHHHNARHEQRFFRPRDAVGHPRAEHGGEINRAAVRANDAARERLVDAQPAFGGFVIEIEQQDALQAVEGKAFPQFDVEQGGKLDRMAEKGLRRGGLGHGFSVALFFCLRPSESAASAQPKATVFVFKPFRRFCQNVQRFEAV